MDGREAGLYLEGRYTHRQLRNARCASRRRARQCEAWRNLQASSGRSSNVRKRRCFLVVREHRAEPLEEGVETGRARNAAGPLSRAGEVRQWAEPYGTSRQAGYTNADTSHFTNGMGNHSACDGSCHSLALRMRRCSDRPGSQPHWLGQDGVYAAPESPRLNVGTAASTRTARRHRLRRAMRVSHRRRAAIRRLRAAAAGVQRLLRIRATAHHRIQRMTSLRAIVPKSWGAKSSQPGPLSRESCTRSSSTER